MHSRAIPEYTQATRHGAYSMTLSLLLGVRNFAHEIRAQICKYVQAENAALPRSASKSYATEVYKLCIWFVELVQFLRRLKSTSSWGILQRRGKNARE